MPGCLTERLRAIVATSILTTLAVIATVPPGMSETAKRPLADALPPAQPSCHAGAFGAAERKWSKLEQLDGTPVVSATLRVRLRGDPVTHSARLACFEGDDGALVCT